MSMVMLGGVIAALVAALSISPTLRFGLISIRQWIDQSERDTILAAPGRWRIAAAGLGLALWSLLVYQQEVADSVTAIIAVSVACGLMASLLLALSKTDLSCRLLPDSLTFSLVAGGLLFHGVWSDTAFITSLIGVTTGYLALWGFATLYQRVRGQAGMGRGDFAMFAGLGAWLGWPSLPMVLVTACVIGILIGLTQRARLIRTGKTFSEDMLIQQQIAFGPALAIAGLIGWAGLV